MLRAIHAGMDDALESRLRAIAHREEQGCFRLQALATDEGRGWGVFDCRESRFLRDDEVEALPLEQLLSLRWVH